MIGVLATWELWHVRDQLRDAQDKLVAAGADIENGRLAEAENRLQSATTQLVGANARLYNAPALGVLSYVPVAHENIESLRRSVGEALSLSSGGARLLQVGRPLQGGDGRLVVPLRGGAIPIEVVKATAVQAEDLAGQLPGPADQPSDRFLVGPVRELQRKVSAESHRRQEQLSSLVQGLKLLLDMSGANGDRRYLIAVANSAEMRGAGGMILSYGVLASTNGSFSLGGFGRIDELELDTAIDPRSLGLPADFLARWHGLEPTRLWRNTTLAPSFPFAAPTMCAMFRAKSALPCDGVIQIDSNGLAAILRGIGPVEVDSVGTVTADNVVDLTLNRAYVDFPARDQRQDVLGDVAKVVFSRLVSGSYASVRPLAEALYETVQQRHIMFWSDKPTAQQPAAFFGGTGVQPPADQLDHVMLTVQNFSKNKLDYYLDTSLQLAGDRPSAALGRVTATITLANSAPADGVSSYVFGGDIPGQRPGVYEGVVSLYVPDGTSLVGAAGDDMTRPATLTTEAGRTLVTFGMDVPASAVRTVTLDLALPPRPRSDPYFVALVPMPRVRPTVVGINLRLDGESSLVRKNAPLVRPENAGETRTTG